LKGAVEEAGVSFEWGEKGNGWRGGSLWVVPTFKPVAEWIPIAVRDLKGDISDRLPAVQNE
jgi:2',3'-cyclic-nucleotide 3'-phosphodiesterase